MKTLVKLLLIVFIAFVILSFAHDSYAQNAGTKLKRGVINFFTGWYEIPVNIKFGKDGSRCLGYAYLSDSCACRL